MLEGRDILCFAPERWEGIWRNRHQIMSRLARRNRVLFVEPRPYLRNLLRPVAGGATLWQAQDVACVMCGTASTSTARPVGRPSPAASRSRS